MADWPSVASLGNPQGLAFDLSGNLYIADERTLMSGKWIPTGSSPRRRAAARAKRVSRRRRAGNESPAQLADRDRDRQGRQTFYNRGIRQHRNPNGRSRHWDHLDHCRHRPHRLFRRRRTASMPTFTYPTGVAVDSSGNVYGRRASDNCAIRKINTTGPSARSRGVQCGMGRRQRSGYQGADQGRTGRGRRRVREPVLSPTPETSASGTSARAASSHHRPNRYGGLSGDGMLVPPPRWNDPVA